MVAAGLAAWVLGRAGRTAEAHQCADIQEVVDAALCDGERVAVAIPRALAEQAAQLWDVAAELLEARTEQLAARYAAQLRTRSARLRAVFARSEHAQ
jgi:hypothetical protein